MSLRPLIRTGAHRERTTCSASKLSRLELPVFGPRESDLPAARSLARSLARYCEKVLTSSTLPICSENSGRTQHAPAISSTTAPSSSATAPPWVFSCCWEAHEASPSLMVSLNSSSICITMMRSALPVNLARSMARLVLIMSCAGAKGAIHHQGQGEECSWRAWSIHSVPAQVPP